MLGFKKNIYTIFSTVCEENIKIDFSGDRVLNSASRPDYIQANDVSVVSSYGLFNGKTSQIFSERFYAVTFRRLEIELLFYSDDTGGPEHQILVSNCDSMARPLGIPELGPNKKPSLAIILSRSTGTLTFLGYSEYSRPAIIRLPYSVSILSISLLFNSLYSRFSKDVQSYICKTYCFLFFRKIVGIMQNWGMMDQRSRQW